MVSPTNTTAAVERREPAMAGEAPAHALSTWPFGATIFLSAFLLFQVQLILGKYFLPWFGGTAAVWTTSLLFFQALLFAGYCYAHWLVTRSCLRTQIAIHACVLLMAGILLAGLWLAWRAPILPDDNWRSSGLGDPTLHVLGALLIAACVPFFVLSSTGPLLQAWFHRAHPQRAPYRLYALSNAGSALGLLAYPFLEEPFFRLTTQARWWGVGFFVFIVLCGITAWIVRRPTALLATNDAEDVSGSGPSVGLRFAWLGIAACGSLLMVATSEEICHELAPLPLLWVVPLFLYLLTFVLCFERDGWYRRWVFGPLLLAATSLACHALARGFNEAGILLVIVYCLALFAGCMVCHGELARMKPAPRYLTSFFLFVAGGGALGGLLAAMVAPRIFRGYWEYHIALWGCSAVFFLCALVHQRSRLLRACAYAALVGLAAVLVTTAVLRDRDAILVARNFYGVVRVAPDHDFPSLHILEVYDGNIVHGAQFMDPDKRDTPAFYGKESGIGVAILHHPNFLSPPPSGFRLGVVGLGSGAMAAFLRRGDSVVFYEINPVMFQIVCGRGAPFTYLNDSPARSEVVLGDARISLENELRRGMPQKFDVLAIDAFHSDAVPVHLLTREAFAIYLQHLRGPESILAVNVTGFHLDLAPVVQRLADEFGMHASYLKYESGDDIGIYQTDWMLLTRDPQVAALYSSRQTINVRPGPLWTDDLSDLLRVIRWREKEE